MLAEFTTQALPYYHSSREKNILVLLGGTNDGFLDGGGGSLETVVEARIQLYHTTARAAGFSTVAVTIPPSSVLFPVGSPQNTVRLAINAWIRANYSNFASALFDLVAIPEMQDPTNTTWFLDGTHPTVAGSQLIANNLKLVLITL
jgi:lysophospholipase L1-like esterase